MNVIYKESTASLASQDVIINLCSLEVSRVILVSQNDSPEVSIIMVQRHPG